MIEDALGSGIWIDHEKDFEGERHPMPRHARIDHELLVRAVHFLKQAIHFEIDISLHLRRNIHCFDGFASLDGKLPEKIAGGKMAKSKCRGDRLRSRGFS